MAHATSFDITTLVIGLLRGFAIAQHWTSAAEVVALLQGKKDAFDDMDNKQQRSKVRAVFKKLVNNNQVEVRDGEFKGRATSQFLWTAASFGCGSCAKTACAKKASDDELSCDATGHADVKVMTQKSLAGVIKSLELTGREPLVVAYGMGLDSTAMLVEFQKRDIMPDIIMFADTGAEKPETYAYLATMNAWLKSVGFPQIVVVKYVPKTAPYTTLEGKSLANEVLPSLSYGAHQCALVFKVEPQNKYINNWQPAVDAWAEGLRVTKAIGYDSSDADLKRSARNLKNLAKVRALAANGSDMSQGEKKLFDDNEKYNYWYPLQDWGLKREQLAEIIKDAGLPVPVKSACFFCPASKKQEIIDLRDNHPDLFKRALDIEAKALNGRHHDNELRAKEGKKPSTVVGLGRTFAWSDFVDSDCEDLDDSKISMPAAG